MFGFHLTPMVKRLLALTVGLHAGGYFLGDSLGFDLSDAMALYDWRSANFAPYQVFTAMFAHADWSHLLHNMLGLFFFGPLLEQVLGSKRMLTFYLICGVGSSVLFGAVQSYQLQELDERRQAFLAEPTPDALHLFVVNSVPGGFEYWVKSEQVYEFVNKDFAESPQNPEYIALGRKMVNEVADFFIDGRSLRGASGAVFGIFMAMLLLFPNLEVQLLFPPIPIKIKYLVTIYTVYEIYYLIQNNPADNVAHLAHLGGMLFAFFLIRRWGIPQQF